MGQRVGDTAAVADDIQTLMTAHELIVHFHFHVIEFYFHAIQKGIVVGCTGSNLIQSIDHLDNSIQNALRQHQAQITGGCVQSGGNEGLLDPVGGGASAPDQIPEALINRFSMNTKAAEDGSVIKIKEIAGSSGAMSIFVLIAAMILLVILEGICKKLKLEKLEPFAMPLAMFGAMGVAILLTKVLPAEIVSHGWYEIGTVIG